MARGSTRYVKTRNLWGAADRDEDNALLHVESIDLFDTPLLRATLTGKAVHTEPHASPDKGPSLPISTSNPAGAETDIVQRVASQGLPAVMLDVDDHSSPAVARRGSPTLAGLSLREFNTSARQQVALAVATGAAAEIENPGLPSPPKVKRKSPTRRKPNYVGMQTAELQKLIKGYGFKAIKSREKMVDLLDKCWNEKEARRSKQQPDGPPDEPVQPAARHADLLSNFHDLSNRPQAKPQKAPKKPRAASKAKAADPTVNESKKRKKPNDDAGLTAKNTTKAPKKRKEAVADNDTAEKPTRGCPKKAMPEPSKVNVLDVDDIDDDSTTLTTIREEKDSVRAKKSADLPTPLQTLHPSNDDDIRDEVLGVTGESESPDGADVVSYIGEKIHAAILHQSEQAADVNGWDHVHSPTWHEKMLLYDPIVIEDLARWLNAEGLNGVQEDREVTTVEVRDWCESKGVCCMWKGGWRGQASKGGE
jgi:hypothetical protein